MNAIMKDYYKKQTICELLEHIAFKVDMMEAEMKGAADALHEEPNDSYYIDKINSLQVKIDTFKEIAKKL